MPSTMRMAPIGSNIPQFMGESSSRTVTRQEQRKQPLHVAVTTTTTTTGFRASPSLLLSLDPNARNILVHGPSKSGKTSLAMNVAYAEASNLATLCSCARQNGCSCRPVALFRLAKTREDGFPTLCVPASSLQNGDKENVDSQSRCNNKQASRTMQSKSCEWDPQILRRVQIHYVSSVREILKELLCVCGKARNQQPAQAIIIDDLDLLVSGEANAFSSIIQTLAVVVETSHALGKSHGSRPAVVVTMACHQSTIPPWMDASVSLETTTSEKHNWKKSLQDRDLQLIQKYIANAHVLSSKNHFTIHYTVAEKSDGSSVIYWEKGIV